MRSSFALLLVYCCSKELYTPAGVVLRASRVTRSRGQGAQDREGVPQDDVRCALVQQLGELFEIQELQQVVQEGSDRRQATFMRHGPQGAGADLVGLHGWSREQGPVEPSSG